MHVIYNLLKRPISNSSTVYKSHILNGPINKLYLRVKKFIMYIDERKISSEVSLLNISMVLLFRIYPFIFVLSDSLGLICVHQCLKKLVFSFLARLNESLGRAIVTLASASASESVSASGLDVLFTVFKDPYLLHFQGILMILALRLDIAPTFYHPDFARWH